MSELGDVSLTRHMIKNYFEGFSTDMTPTDWFAMFDKLLMFSLPERLHGLVRLTSRVGFAIDRLIPAGNSIALKLSGAVFTKVTKPESSG